jgi:hypothetical protein
MNSLTKKEAHETWVEVGTCWEFSQLISCKESPTCIVAII